MRKLSKTQLENQYLRRKFRGTGHTGLRKMIVNNFSDQLDIIEEYQKMISWCTSKRKKPSLLRFNNWVKRAVNFKKDQHTTDDWDEDEKATRTRIEKLK